MSDTPSSNDSIQDQFDSFNSGIIRKTQYFDLFISYKRDNGEDHGQKLAEELYEKLTKDGYKVWLDNQEIGFSSDFETRIEEALIHSKKVACIIGPAWVNSDNCRYELKNAIAFEKRIIPIHYQEFRGLLASKKDEGALTEHEWRRVDKPQEIDFSSKEKYAKAYSDLKAVCKLKDDITTEHTKILVESFYWKNFNTPKSMLLTGAALSKVKVLKKKSDGDPESPTFTELQNKFIDASQSYVSSEVSNKRSAYILYNSDQAEYAADLNMELKLNNVSTWFEEDLNDAKSNKSYVDAIINSDNVLRVVNKESTNENDERLAFAASNSKRILTVSYSSTTINKLKSEDTKNCYLWKDQARIDGLVSAINGDKAYTAAHAKLLALAFEWERSEKSKTALLGFKEAKAQQEWYTNAEKLGLEPQPNLSMISFVERSITHADSLRKRRRALIGSIILGGIILLISLWGTKIAYDEASEAEEGAAAAQAEANMAKVAADSLKARSARKAILANQELDRLQEEQQKLKDDNDAAVARMEADFTQQKRDLELKAETDAALAEAKRIQLLRKFKEDTAKAGQEYRAFVIQNEHDRDSIAQLGVEIKAVIDSKRAALAAYGHMQAGARSQAKDSADRAVIGLDSLSISTEIDALHQVYNWLLPDTSVLKREFDNMDSLLKSLAIDGYHKDTSSTSHAIDFDHPSIRDLLAEDSLLYSAGALNGDHKLFAFGTKEGKIRIYGLDSNDNYVDTFSVYTNAHRINKIAISPDGKQLAFSCIDETITLISLDDNQQKEKYSEIITTPVIARIEELYFLKNGVLITVNTMGAHHAVATKVAILKEENVRLNDIDAAKKTTNPK